VPPALDDVIRRALAKVPADRYDTPTEFAAAVAAAASSEVVATPPAPADRRPRASRTVMFAAGLLTAALVGVLLVWQAGHGGRASAEPATRAGDVTRPTTIAVLPFENLGPASEEYFAAGMTEEVTDRLGAVSGLGLIPRRSAQRYARSDLPLRQVGRELGSDYLLVGTVRWAGGADDDRRVRITLALLRAADERQVWSSTYDRVIQDIFEVQSDIAGQVVARLGVTPLAGERSTMRAKPTGNSEAYTLYLKGRYFWNKRTDEDIQTALDYFQRAVDLDPGYSLAWVGIGDTWIFRGWYSRLAPRETFPRAKQAIVTALKFDSTLAEAHASMGHIRLEFDHDWADAEREYRRAIALNPKYPTAHHWYGGYLSAMGRHEEALQQARTALALDPLSPIIQTWVGLRYYFAGKNEEAIREYLKALELDRDFAPAHWHLGWAYAQTGRFEESVAEAEKALALDPGNLAYLASQGHALARAGRTGEARATLARLTRASAGRYVPAYHVAAIYVALEDTSAALDWVQRAYEERSSWFGYLGVDPLFDPLRPHPKFRSLLEKQGLHHSS
jgi:TolB-like protein/Tfp pilus assembly protein PilF